MKFVSIILFLLVGCANIQPSEEYDKDSPGVDIRCHHRTIYKIKTKDLMLKLMEWKF